MKYQIAKLYHGDDFRGYAIAVDGQLLDKQVSTIISTEPGCIPTATVVFNLDSDHAENQITINLDRDVPIQMNGSPADSTVEAIKKAAAEGAKCGYRETANAFMGRK
ncbi:MULTISPECIES: hypothetical protein [Klebsiella pneumoniae complex]|uniref:hypothetical protein n=1 Tax=Klebsiella pneumoniae complex TaxID=3390273 RepID=UPI000931B519|nr:MULTISPECIES: hypothetical protein [Klebsiella]AVO96988.1 hypothetical protein AM475_20335 [Klebsiella pneumoniae subsp. ozaenae]AWA62410.1 hypothetical protein CLQ68_10965 [Klebsiella pneumoniae]AXU02220.1 hypothetical protein BT110_11190 [Klebsiella pneumoniae]AXZ21739.1 hypothetical protein AM476_28055 [Klebsiella pneumoniae]EIX9642072.1 hypothetical protein [Klebsiella pneumoniae]